MEEDEKELKIKTGIKELTTFLIVTAITILIIIIGNNKYNLENDNEKKYLKAEITSVFENELSEEEIKEENIKKDISFEARLTEKNETNEINNATIFGRQVINDLIFKNTVKEGDKVILTKNEGSEIYTFVDYNKTNLIILSILLFIALAIAVGLWKGFKAVITILLDVLLIFFVYIPAILSGINIYLSTTLLITYITVINSILFSGFNKKASSSVVSVILGTMAIAGVTLLINQMFMITGITTEESTLFVLNNPDLKIDLMEITWAGIIIGTLGAVISIASHIANVIRTKAKEMEENLEKKSFKELYCLGISEGRTKIEQILNTLILAFIGSTLSMFLFFIASYKDTFFLFNSEQIVLLIIQIIISGSGVFLIIPITSLISSTIELRNKEENRKFVQKYSEGLSLNLNKKKNKDE